MNAVLMLAKALASPVLRRFDLEVRRYSNTLRAKRARLFASCRTDLVLDVGANTGQYGRQLRSTGFRGRIVSFEPLPDASAELERAINGDSLWEGRNLALGEKDGQVTMNVSGNSVSSSVLSMEQRAERAAPDSAYVDTCDVQMARLDSVAPSLLSPDGRIHLKLDVQGYEMQVLQGATLTLPRIASVEAEMSLVPLYEGQALLPELIDHLSSEGFQLVWVESGFVDRSTGDMLQLDGLFRRRAEVG